MGKVIAPPRIFKKDRKMERADIEEYLIQPGDKWFDTQNKKVYLVIRPLGGAVVVASVDN